MDATLILVKTGKGVEEIKSRAFGLPQNLRSLLIMVDGSASLAGLLRRVAQVPKAEESLSWLLREGFVETVAPGSPRAAAAAPTTSRMGPKQMLVVLSRDLLGADATKVVQRLDEAGDTPAELAAAVERCHKLIKLTIDEKKAEQFLKSGQALLADFK
jgi:sarcosine oxidase gamma subunit